MTRNYPWHAAVHSIAEEREDVTLAWQVGLPGREQALRAGIQRWTDPRFNAAVAGVRGAYARVLDRMLALNREPDGPAVSPATITTEAGVWGQLKAIEFYVDFETVSNLDDDLFSHP